MLDIILAVLVATAPAQRIVTLGGAVTETVFALGAGDRVVAVDASSLHPAAAQQRTQVGYHRTVSAEGILSLAPQLVIGTEDSGPPVALEQVRGAGVPVEVVTAAPGVEAAKVRIRKLAAILDRRERGEELVSLLDRELAQAGPAITCARSSAPRVLFLLGRGGGSIAAAGKGTAANEMIHLAGGVNAVDQYEGYRPLTPEAAAAAQPDVILTTTGALAAAGGKDALALVPGLGSTPAARIVALDDLFLLGFGPRTGAAVGELARKLGGAACGG